MMVPAHALSRLLAVQPVLDAVERDQAAPRAAFDRLIIGQAVTGQVKSQTNGLSLVTIEGQTVAMRLPYPVKTGDPLKPLTPTLSTKYPSTSLRFVVGC